MKKYFFLLLAAVYSFAAFAQTQGTRKFRAWYDDVIIWQCDAALIDSLNFFIDTQSGTDGDNNTGSGSAEEKAQIYVGVVAFNKSVSQMPITKEVEKAKTFIRERTNDQDFTAFAYSVSQGNKLFDAEGLPAFDKIFMLNFSDGVDNYSNMLWGMEGRMVGPAYVYDTARYDLLQRAELNSYAMTFGNDEGFSTKMRQVVKGSGKYHNAETSADLQSTFNEIAQSILASAKNVVLTTNPGFYSDEMGYKYFRFNFTADNGMKDTIYAKLEGTPFMGFTLNITQAGKYARFDAPVQGVYDQENTGKVFLPLNNLKFVYNGEELQYTFEPYYSPDNTLFYTDVEEASTEESVSKRVAVVLVLDCSKSMGEAFEPMKEAAIDFIETLETLAPIVTVTPNDETMGTITGGGQYENGDVVTLTATANAGYYFVRWSDGVTENPRTVTVTESLQLTAEFAPLINVILSVNGAAMGSVTGGGQYKNGETITLTATPVEGYRFVQWSDGVKTNPRTITVEEDLSLTAQFMSSTINGHEYVDLGLPSGLLWATCNVGATRPEDYGSYFAWGETTTKDDYSSSSYTYSSKPTTLPLSKDAARANWGGTWRMPTAAEFDELLASCTWTWTTNYNSTGRAGYIVKSKVSGNTNSIFLPAAGYRNGASLNDAGSRGYYWSSSLNSSLSSNAWSLYFHSGYHGTGSSGGRYFGQSVRPVCSSVQN